MKRIILLAGLLLFTALNFPSLAQVTQNYPLPNVRYAIPVFFHGNASLSTQSCYDLVDELNANFLNLDAQLGGAGRRIVFYVGDIDASGPSCGGNHKVGGMNVYIGLCGGSDGSFTGGYITLAGYDASVLTHEMGHALGLQHQVGPCVNSNWNHPLNTNDPIKLAGCYGPGIGLNGDCLTDTDPAIGNWMNQATLGPSVFTYCQYIWMLETVKRRVTSPTLVNKHEWMIFPTPENGNYNHGILSTPTAANNLEVPVPVVDWNYSPYLQASIKFRRPGDHSKHYQANYVTVTVASMCPSGSTPVPNTGYVVSTTLTGNMTETIYIPKCTGVYYIDYAFQENANSGIKWRIRQIVNYNPPTPPVSSPGCGCSTGPGDPGSKMANLLLAEGTHIEQYVQGNNLIYKNAGFKKYIIYNMLGQTVNKGELSDGSHTINIADLSSGIYLITVYGNQGNKETMRFKK